MTPAPPTSTLFPYTTLFRSALEQDEDHERDHQAGGRERREERADERREAPQAAHLLGADDQRLRRRPGTDRKSTRLNSSHPSTSYAVFCLKKKNLSETQEVQ